MSVSFYFWCDHSGGGGISSGIIYCLYIISPPLSISVFGSVSLRFFFFCSSVCYYSSFHIRSWTGSTFHAKNNIEPMNETSYHCVVKTKRKIFYFFRKNSIRKNTKNKWLDLFHFIFFHHQTFLFSFDGIEKIDFKSSRIHLCEKKIIMR